MASGLRARWVLVITLLVVSMVVVIGAFLINGTYLFFENSFEAQMKSAFVEHTDFLPTLEREAQGDNAPQRLNDVLSIFAGTLGVDNRQRNYYVLDGRTKACLAGSDEKKSVDISLTILSALEGTPAYSRGKGQAYMDAAVRVGQGDHTYIIYIKDTKENLRELVAQNLGIIFNAMLLGLAIAILWTLILTKTMTRPIAKLTKAVTQVAAGNFAEPLAVDSTDEIGILTQSFNHMAHMLRDTMEAMTVERDKLETLFAHMTDGVAAFYQDGAPMQANPAAERYLNCPFGKMQSYDQVLGVAAPLAEVLLVAQPAYLEREISIVGRALQVFLLRFATMQGDGVMAVIHDVTEQKRLDALRREFVSNVSHELRTPLTNIKSYAETLAEDENLPPEMSRRFIQVILKESDRMNLILRDLLTLSQFDYAKLDWKLAPFSPMELLGNLYNAFLMDAKRRELALTLSLEPLPAQMMGDAARIEQVLANILSNALKYTPPGGQVDIAAGQSGGDIWFAVRDTGVGIPEEDLPRVFERFYRVDKARARESGGTGLGLSIALEIVKLHGGHIDIRSTSGEGTLVTVTLPTQGPVA